MLESDFASKIESQPDIKEKLKPLLDDQEIKNLVSKLKKDRLLVIVLTWVCAAVLLGIVIYLIGYIQGQITAVIVFAVMFLILGLGITFNAIKRSKDNYGRHFVPKVVKAIYGEKATFVAKNGFSLEYLSSLNLFRVVNVKQEDFISGTYKGIPCMGCDVIATHEESSGKSSSTVTDFQGCIYSFKLNKKANPWIYVSEVRPYSINNSVFRHKVQLESIQFNEKFHTYCQDEHTAFYIITPQLEESMMNIEKSFPGEITFIFREEELVVLISGHLCEYKVDFNASIEKNLIAILNAVVPLSYVIEEMHLDHKFSLTEEDLSTIKEDKVANDKDNDDLISSLEPEDKDNNQQHERIPNRWYYLKKSLCPGSFSRLF